jgi:polyhydroxybutyrate depolymerase
MSNGGTMSHHLAGVLSEDIAAIASVSGPMTQHMVDVSDPVHPTPVMHIHGTEDPLAPYDGNPIFLPVADALQYWVDYNNCDPTPTITELPDIDPDDGSTVEHIVYEGGDDNVNVEHFKIIGGSHIWPNNPGPGNHDIDVTEEIWDFLSQY